ncbi:hypothetical protein [Phenylobacterium sp.]|uniref:hypothetical protein n=1 Tax=Phenylobacterium sp. TaxID=1871053 RepID=UPI0011F747B2|nr:hypothetical protein [Phenylobacterium sp.]THD59085.1 MAG: hypothetical protein E8A12_11845 [Phenylobacterium sp.]
MTKLFQHLGLAAAACAVALCGCATRPEAPRMAARAPARPAPPTLRDQAPAPSGLAVQASAFEAFMRHARRIDPAFGGPSDVAQALQTAATHEPHELEAGMIAYAALAALQEPRFVAAARAEGPDLARRIAADPQAVLALPGAEAAEARASGALYAEGSALSGEGEKIKHAAYTVQHQAWAKAKVPDAAGRLSRVKRLSGEAYQPAREDAAELQMSLAGAARRSGAPSPVVARGLALAALSVLGETRQAQSLMSEPRTTSCLHMAKLNLYQCLASAGPHYEDIFCLGQHAMIDPGQCVVEATEARAEAPRRVAVTRASFTR